MKYVYVVRGSTGEYSDRSTWSVRAFLHELMAKDYVLFLDKKYNEAISCYSNSSWHFDRKKLKDIEEKMLKFDEQFMVDYTGTHYWYEQVELENSEV